MCRPVLTAGFLAYSFHSLLTARLIFDFRYILPTNQVICWSYGFHSYSPAWFFGAYSFHSILTVHPDVGRHYGEIFPDPSDRRQRRRPGEPDHLIATDHLDHRS